ncbi:uncharacterized protein AAEQ78_000453 isoform 2-T2 [Lycaon pictus]
MTPDPHAEVLRGGAGAPSAALVPEQLRFLEPDVHDRGSFPRAERLYLFTRDTQRQRQRHRQREKQMPRAEGRRLLLSHPVSSIPAVLHPEVGSNRCYCVLGPRAAEEGGSAPGTQVPGSVDLDVPSPDAVALMAADRARLRSCCHPDLLLLGPQAKEGHDVPSRPDGPKQRPGSRERPRPRPPECCCRPPVRVWELAWVTAPGTVGSCDGRWPPGAPTAQPAVLPHVGERPLGP